MTPPATFPVELADETATAGLMADLALLIGPGDVITLSGDLGAGKTAAARAMIRYLADDETMEVPSPTFTLAQSYELPAFPLLHADLYRINDPAELQAPCRRTGSISRSPIALSWARAPDRPRSPATANPQALSSGCVHCGPSLTRPATAMPRGGGWPATPRSAPTPG